MSEIGESIIGYYKQALEARNNNKKELIEDISNSIEVLDTIQVVEEIQAAIDAIDDPLEKFLFKFTNILKDNKQEDRQQLIEEFSEKIEETLQNEEKEETKSDDPLEKFLLKINDIIVTDKNEIVKNTALDLIEQLKNKDEIVQEEEEIKELPIPPQPELGEVPNVTPPLEVEEPQPKEKETISPKNIYVKELQNADKDVTKAAEEDALAKTIREEVGKQVKEILSKYRNGVVAEGGGGDGNFSKEFRYGGTMEGSLDVLGKYLSGGVDLFNIFSNSGGGSQTLSYNNSGNLSISSGNTVTLSSFKTVNASSQILSADTDLFDIFLTSETDSQTLSFNDTTSELSISNGNTVPLSGYVIPNIQNITQNYLPLSGGTLNGELNVYANTYINNNLTVGGSLTALGTATFANTLFTTTSALSVVNTGPGPALYVYQSAGPYDVASFYDGDGIEVLHVGNANPSGLGRIGVNESFPNKELTVRGSISATEFIYAPSVLVDLLEPDPLSPNNKLQVSSLTVLGTDPVGGQPTTTILKGGAFFGAADGTRGIMVEKQTALGDAIYFTGLNDQITEYNNILFTTGYYPQFWLEKNTGNVGIGTNTPTSTLDVNGTITTTSDGNSLQWNETYTNVQSNSASWFSPIRQFDYVVSDGISYNYCGSANQGSLTSDSTWTIKRLLFTSAGTFLSAGVVYNSIWDNRYSYSY